jgi:uncharacterized protein YjbI with pentapeptide repeats
MKNQVTRSKNFDYRNATLREPENKFVGREMPYADFFSFTSWSPDFEGANLYKADFQEATMWDADFKGADIRCARFDGVTMWDADFKGAKVAGASFNGAKLCNCRDITGKLHKGWANIDDFLANADPIYIDVEVVDESEPEKITFMQKLLSKNKGVPNENTTN